MILDRLYDSRLNGLLRAAPGSADRLARQPAARSSGSAFQTKCLVYDMSTMHMRWRLASSTMLHVNPKVRGQHPRRLERRAGSPPLSSRWSSTNVEITDCQLGQLITGQLGFGGGVCHHRMPPRSGRETSARTSRALSVHQKVRTPYIGTHRASTETRAFSQPRLPWRRTRPSWSRCGVRAAFRTVLSTAAALSIDVLTLPTRRPRSDPTAVSSWLGPAARSFPRWVGAVRGGASIHHHRLIPMHFKVNI